MAVDVARQWWQAWMARPAHATLPGTPAALTYPRASPGNPAPHPPAAAWGPLAKSLEVLLATKFISIYLYAGFFLAFFF